MPYQEKDKKRASGKGGWQNQAGAAFGLLRGFNRPELQAGREWGRYLLLRLPGPLQRVVD